MYIWEKISKKLSIITQVPSSTSLRWLHVWDNRPSVAKERPMDSKIEPCLTLRNSVILLVSCYSLYKLQIFLSSKLSKLNVIYWLIHCHCETQTRTCLSLCGSDNMLLNFVVAFSHYMYGPYLRYFSQRSCSAWFCGEQFLQWFDPNRVLLSHHGREGGAGGHRGEDSRDWVHATSARQGRLCVDRKTWRSVRAKKIILFKEIINKLYLFGRSDFRLREK